MVYMISATGMMRVQRAEAGAETEFVAWSAVGDAMFTA
jgi:hypothetical protein